MILIKNGKIITMTGTTYDKGCVLIEGSVIKSVGENIQVGPEVEIVNAEGMTVIPGIIDAHCHIGMWEDSLGFEGDDGNEMTDPITPQLRAIDSVNPMERCFAEAYEAGVTTVMTGPGSGNVIGGQFAVLKTFGRRVDDMVVKAPAAMKIAFGENPKRIYSAKNQSPQTRMATAGLLRETLMKAVEYKEKKDRAKGDPEKMPPIDAKMEALLPVLRREIPLKAHAHRADDLFTALRIAKEFNLRITLDHVTEGSLIVDLLKEEDVPLIVGPSFGSRSKVELKELSFKTPGVLSNAGIKVALMTDHPVIPLKYLTMCAAYAVKDGMKEEDALKAITINPAQILEVDDRVGSIEPGKDADIAIFDGDPLDVMSSTRYVFINGKMVFRRQE